MGEAVQILFLSTPHAGKHSLQDYTERIQGICVLELRMESNMSVYYRRSCERFLISSLQSRRILAGRVDIYFHRMFRLSS